MKSSFFIIILWASSMTEKVVNGEPHASLTVEGGGSLVGEFCPGTVRLFCEGVDLTFLRWAYNGNTIMEFYIDDSPEVAHSPVMSIPAFISVELSDISQSNSINRANFSSILSIEISQQFIEKENITSISCGNSKTIGTIEINIQLKEQPLPVGPEFYANINVVSTNICSVSESQLILSWKPPAAVCPSDLFYHNITLTSIERRSLNGSTQSAVINGSVCTTECSVVFTLSGPGNYHLLLQSVKNREGNESVTQNITMCEIPTCLKNGEFKASNIVGGILTLTCHEGFKVMGPQNATCMPDNSWHPNLKNTSRCVPTKTKHMQEQAGLCKHPSEPINGRILNHGDFNKSLSEGSDIAFFCDGGFSPVGQYTATCNSSGEWSSNPEDLECYPIVKQSESAYLTLVITVSCSTGALFTVIGFIILTVMVRYFRQKEMVRRAQKQNRNSIHSYCEIDTPIRGTGTQENSKASVSHNETLTIPANPNESYGQIKGRTSKLIRPSTIELKTNVSYDQVNFKSVNPTDLHGHLPCCASKINELSDVSLKINASYNQIEQVKTKGVTVSDLQEPPKGK